MSSFAAFAAFDNGPPRNCPPVRSPSCRNAGQCDEHPATPIAAMQRNIGPTRFMQSRRLMKGYLLCLRREKFLLGSYSAVKRNTRIAMGLSALFSIVKEAFSDRDSVTAGVSSR